MILIAEEVVCQPRADDALEMHDGHLENLVFAAKKLEGTRPHRSGFARAIN
jgi:hypothetical protein